MFSLSSSCGLESICTPQKMRWSSRARVVFPLDDGPEIPTIRAFSGFVGPDEVISCGEAVVRGGE